MGGNILKRLWETRQARLIKPASADGAPAPGTPGPARCWMLGGHVVGFRPIEKFKTLSSLGSQALWSKHTGIFYRQPSGTKSEKAYD